MTIDEFRDCLLDYYQTEVRGEGVLRSHPDRLQLVFRRQLPSVGSAAVEKTEFRLGGYGGLFGDRAKAC